MCEELAAWSPGGGGLVSTVSDYMRFALMLWNGGEYRGTRILTQSAVDDMTRLHVADGVLGGGGPGGAAAAAQKFQYYKDYKLTHRRPSVRYTEKYYIIL